MENDKLFERMQELSGIEGTGIKSNRDPNQEDELNYYVYELLSEAEVESKSNRVGDGYNGTVRFYLPITESYDSGDIVQSIKYEKDLYKDYIQGNIDLSFLTDGTNHKIRGINSAIKEDKIIVDVKYESKFEDGEELEFDY